MINKYSLRYIFLPFLLFPISSLALPVCEQGSAIPAEQKCLAKAVGAGWMGHAVYCDFGTFQVLAPQDDSAEAILVFKNGKMFFLSQKGFGINLFQEYFSQGSAPYLTVQDWDNDGLYERLDYSLSDNNGEVIGMVQDKIMDGNPTVILYKKQEKKGGK